MIVFDSVPLTEIHMGQHQRAPENRGFLKAIPGRTSFHLGEAGEFGR